MEITITDNFPLRTFVPDPVVNDTLETSILNAVIEMWKEHWRVQALIIKSQPKDKLFLHGNCGV